MHESAHLGPALQKVFVFYGIFWVTVIAVLLIAIGPLLKKSERGSHHGDHDGGHSAH